MQVQVLDYNNLNEIERNLIEKLTAEYALYMQLWFIALLSEDKVKIFKYGNYETILFVPFRSKFSIKYAYMPVFLQKISFIGNKEGIKPIIQELKKTLRFGELSIENFSEDSLFDNIKNRRNYTLNLNRSYESLRRDYSENHKRNCSKASDLEVLRVNELEGLISIFKSEKNIVLSNKQMKSFVFNLFKLYKFESIRKCSIILNAFDKNKLVASMFLLEFKGVLYYVLGASIKSDKTVSSNGLFRLFDYLIKSHSDQNVIIDFAGSDISGVARFFKGFGSIESEFQFVRWNELPFLLKKIKN